MPRHPQPRLPLDALLKASGMDKAVVGISTGWAGKPCPPYTKPAPLTTFASRLGLELRRVNRWAHDGIPLDAAEDAAFALGLHPLEVWPDEWLDAIGVTA